MCCHIEAGTIFASMHLCVLKVYVMVVNFFQLRLFIQDKIPWPNWCFLYSFGDQDSTVVTVLSMGWAFEVCFPAGVGVTLSRPAYVHTQPPLYLILGSLPRVLWLDIELFFCFHLVRADERYTELCIHTPTRLHSMVLHSGLCQFYFHLTYFVPFLFLPHPHSFHSFFLRCNCETE